MRIRKWQQEVDDWIKEYGIRYFDEKTNTLLLVEEVGELARHVARSYGEQSYKKEVETSESKKHIADEIGDVLFVLTCIANQMDLDLETIISENIDKKTKRDHTRHLKNDKLKEE